MPLYEPLDALKFVLGDKSITFSENIGSSWVYLAPMIYLSSCSYLR